MMRGIFLTLFLMLAVFSAFTEGQKPREQPTGKSQRPHGLPPTSTKKGKRPTRLQTFNPRVHTLGPGGRISLKRKSGYTDTSGLNAPRNAHPPVLSRPEPPSGSGKPSSQPNMRQNPTNQLSASVGRLGTGQASASASASSVSVSASVSVGAAATANANQGVRFKKQRHSNQNVIPPASTGGPTGTKRSQSQGNIHGVHGQVSAQGPTGQVSRGTPVQALRMRAGPHISKSLGGEAVQLSGSQAAIQGSQKSRGQSGTQRSSGKLGSQGSQGHSSTRNLQNSNQKQPMPSYTAFGTDSVGSSTSQTSQTSRTNTASKTNTFRPIQTKLLQNTQTGTRNGKQHDIHVSQVAGTSQQRTGSSAIKSKSFQSAAQITGPLSRVSIQSSLSTSGQGASVANGKSQRGVYRPFSSGRVGSFRPPTRTKYVNSGSRFSSPPSQPLTNNAQPGNNGGGKGTRIRSRTSSLTTDGAYQRRNGVGSIGAGSQQNQPQQRSSTVSMKGQGDAQGDSYSTQNNNMDLQNTKPNTTGIGPTGNAGTSAGSSGQATGYQSTWRARPPTKTKTGLSPFQRNKQGYATTNKTPLSKKIDGMGTSSGSGGRIAGSGTRTGAMPSPVSHPELLRRPDLTTFSKTPGSAGGTRGRGGNDPRGTVGGNVAGSKGNGGGSGGYGGGSGGNGGGPGGNGGGTGGNSVGLGGNRFASGGYREGSGGNGGGSGGNGGGSGGNGAGLGGTGTGPGGYSGGSGGIVGGSGGNGGGSGVYSGGSGGNGGGPGRNGAGPGGYSGGSGGSNVGGSGGNGGGQEGYSGGSASNIVASGGHRDVASGNVGGPGGKKAGSGGNRGGSGGNGSGSGGFNGGSGGNAGGVDGNGGISSGNRRGSGGNGGRTGGNGDGSGGNGRGSGGNGRGSGGNGRGSSGNGGVSGANDRGPGGNGGRGGQQMSINKPCSTNPVCASDGYTYLSDCYLRPGLETVCDGFCPCPVPLPPPRPAARPPTRRTSAQFDPPPPCNCPMVYDPVCGVNGITYDNDCQRRCNYVGLRCAEACSCDSKTKPRPSNATIAKYNLTSDGKPKNATTTTTTVPTTTPVFVSSIGYIYTTNLYTTTLPPTRIARKPPTTASASTTAPKRRKRPRSKSRPGRRPRPKKPKKPKTTTTTTPKPEPIEIEPIEKEAGPPPETSTQYPAYDYYNAAPTTAYYDMYNPGPNYQYTNNQYTNNQYTNNQYTNNQVYSPFKSPASCDCPNYMSPVCGTDGITYENPCTLGCARTWHACDGECPCHTPEPAPYQPPVSCDSQCSNVFEPVCSINDHTYDNDCLRECSQEPKDCDGECPCRRETYAHTDVNNEPSNQPLSTCECTSYDVDPVCTTEGETIWYGCEAICLGKTIACSSNCPC